MSAARFVGGPGVQRLGTVLLPSATLVELLQLPPGSEVLHGAWLTAERGAWFLICSPCMPECPADAFIPEVTPGLQREPITQRVMLHWPCPAIPEARPPAPAPFDAPCPHAALLDAAFCLAVSGEGAYACTVRGWENLLRAFAAALWTDGDPSHKPEQWAEWMGDLSNVDEWTTDEGRTPFGFSTELGEISHLSIYRLAE